MSAKVTEIPHAGANAFLSPMRWSAEPHASLADHGYDVREFTLSDVARLYADTGAPTPVTTGVSVDYATRVLVIAPRASADFHGRVHVELLNPSVGVDFPMYWSDAGPHIVRSGDAYVGVTCKNVTVSALASMRPDRYGHLTFPHDGAVWDLLGAVGTLLHTDQGGGLLPGLQAPRRVLATGWSQSGSFLRTYLSEHLHDTHSAASGSPVYDAYLLGVASGGFGPMGYIPLDRDGEFTFDADLRPTGAMTNIPIDDPRRTIRAAPVPTFEYMSEDESIQHVWHQRHDSDAPGDLYRLYQIPGRGHEPGLLSEMDRLADYAEMGEQPNLSGAPPVHPASRFLIAAAIENLFAWTEGTTPPRAEPISVQVHPQFLRDPEGIDYSGVSIVADSDGHARGGVRYLEIDLPICRMYVEPTGPATIREWRHEPYSRAEMRRRYGSRARLAELAESRMATLVREGSILPEDAAAAVAAYLAAADI